MCHLEDIVKEAVARLKPDEGEEPLPLPEIDETDPHKREAALLKAAGYTVQVTVTEKAGMLLVVQSPALAQAGKTFYVILPPQYPADPPAWALVQRSVKLAEAEFELPEEIPPGFSILTQLERLFPAAREDRALSLRSKGERFSTVHLFVYFLLFMLSSLAGYVWASGLHREVQAAWTNFVAAVQRSAGMDTPGVTVPERKGPGTMIPKRVVLKRSARILAVVLDAGPSTNITPKEAQWAISSALPSVRAEAIQLDLRDTRAAVEAAQAAAAGAQAVVVFTYGAGARQINFLEALQTAAHLPVGAISMSLGTHENTLRTAAAFYGQAEKTSGKKGAQQALLGLKKNGIIETQ